MQRSGHAVWKQTSVLGIVLVLGCGLIAAAAPAQTVAGDVGLEELLRLPESFDVGGESVAGATASEWRSRFRGAREALKAAHHALESVHEELGTLAGDTSQYQVAAPGITPDPENTPMSYRLRQEIRRRREQLEARERELRALVVEANLAGVPESWQQEPTRGE